MSVKIAKTFIVDLLNDFDVNVGHVIQLNSIMATADWSQLTAAQINEALQELISEGIIESVGKNAIRRLK